MNGPTLRGQLLGWTLTALLLLWGVFVVVGYNTGKHEADELTDGHLAGVAALLVRQQGATFDDGAIGAATQYRPDLSAHDYQQSMHVVVWNADGSVLTHSAHGPLPAFSPQEGFATLSLDQPATRWRTFSRWNAQKDRKIMVLVSLDERDALAHDIAGQMMEPGLWLLPLLALGLGLAVVRGLQPLVALAKEINQLDVHRPAPLVMANRHLEFRASMEAINALVERYQASLQRERALADEFAHELRTPLTSLALQVRALRDDAIDTQTRAAIARLEHDVRRAGEVVSHLLALARISRAQRDDALTPLDLTELARRVVGDFAHKAFDSDHELSFHGNEPMWIRGHAALLEIALLNLLENAVSHTPPGTVIEVQALPQIAALQVCDGPPESTPAPDRARTTGGSLGLGLGHQVVQKVAELHDARFGQVDPPPGRTTCYRLSFSQASATTTAVSGGSET